MILVSQEFHLCFKIIVLKTRGKKRKRSDTDLTAAKALLPGYDRFLNELRGKIQAENEGLLPMTVPKHLEIIGGGHKNRFE